VGALSSDGSRYRPFAGNRSNYRNYCQTNRLAYANASRSCLPRLAECRAPSNSGARTNGTPGRCTRDPWARCSWARSTCAPGADKESLRGREQTHARARARADSLSRVIIIRQFGPAANSLAREARIARDAGEHLARIRVSLSARVQAFRRAMPSRREKIQREPERQREREFDLECSSGRAERQGK